MFFRGAAYFMKRWCKPSEKHSNLFENVFPRRSLFYEKIVQAEWKEKNLFNFLFRAAAILFNR